MRPSHHESATSDPCADTRSLAERSCASVREPMDPRVPSFERSPDTVLDEGYIHQLHERRQHATYHVDDEKDKKGQIQSKEGDSSEESPDETTYVSRFDPESP